MDTSHAKADPATKPNQSEETSNVLDKFEQSIKLKVVQCATCRGIIPAIYRFVFGINICPRCHAKVQEQRRFDAVNAEVDRKRRERKTGRSTEQWKG